MTIGLGPDELAREVALDLADGDHVNLGIGMPTSVARFIPADREVVLHSENGILGVAPLPEGDAGDGDLVDAGKRRVALRPGGSYVDHAQSFGIIRGAHLDVAVMGALQVSAAGDLANWWTRDGIPGVGGAMDLAVGARRVVVMMRHVDRAGGPKIVDELTLPVTGRAVVARIYTDLGTFELRDRRLHAIGLAPGCDRDYVQARTAIPVVVAAHCCELPRKADP